MRLRIKKARWWRTDEEGKTKVKRKKKRGEGINAVGEQEEGEEMHELKGIMV